MILDISQLSLSYLKKEPTQITSSSEIKIIWENELATFTVNTESIEIDPKLLNNDKSRKMKFNKYFNYYYLFIIKKFRSLKKQSSCQVTDTFKNLTKGKFSLNNTKLGIEASGYVIIEIKDEYKPDEQFPTAFEKYNDINGKFPTAESLCWKLKTQTRVYEMEYNIEVDENEDNEEAGENEEAGKAGEVREVEDVDEEAGENEETN